MGASVRISVEILLLYFPFFLFFVFYLYFNAHLYFLFVSYFVYGLFSTIYLSMRFLTHLVTVHCWSKVLSLWLFVAATMSLQK